MVQAKHMNEESFAKTIKALNVAGELVRARQEEKQSLLDEFDQECKRFFFGKISERSLSSSVKKTNKELQRLDKEIRKNMALSRSADAKLSKLVAAQAPTVYRATLSGIVSPSSKPKRRKVKRAKKTAKRAKRKTRKATKKKRTAKKSSRRKRR